MRRPGERAILAIHRVGWDKLCHFKESTGDSPKVFVQKIRVEMSKALLENTQLRMDAILERIGYSDDSAFRRLFKKYTGLSPREYRERFGEKGFSQ